MSTAHVMLGDYVDLSEDNISASVNSHSSQSRHLCVCTPAESMSGGLMSVTVMSAGAGHSRTLTVSRHPHHQAFLKAALLAAVPVDPHDGAALVLKALLVLDVLLDTPPEEALCVCSQTQRAHVRTSHTHL